VTGDPRPTDRRAGALNTFFVCIDVAGKPGLPAVPTPPME